MKSIQALLLILLLSASCAGPRIKVKEDINVLKSNLEKDPNNAVSHYNLGLAHLSQDNYDDALSCFYNCIERDPMFGLAHFAIYCTEYKKDKQLYRESLKDDPAEQYLTKIDSVQNHFQKAFFYDPFFDWSLMTILMESKEHSADLYTQELLDLIYEIYYDGFEAFFLGKYETAIEKLNFQIKMLPQFHLARFFRGLAYSQIKDYDASINDFTVLIDSLESYNKNKILPIYLETSELYYLVGNAYKLKGDLTNAQTAFQKILLQDMSYYMAHVQLAWIYEQKKDLRRAIRELDAALYVDPDNPVLHYNKAVYLSATGNIPGSIKEYTRATELNKYAYKAYFNLGLLYEYQKEYQDALKSFSKFMEYVPQNEASSIEKAEIKIDELNKRGIQLP